MYIYYISTFQLAYPDTFLTFRSQVRLVFSPCGHIPRQTRAFADGINAAITLESETHDYL